MDEWPERDYRYLDTLAAAQANAEQFNEPGRFTALIGFEWTSIATPEAPGNLHRVVIFKDDAEKARRVLPFSTFDSHDPEDLWRYMQAYEDATGGSVLAIAQARSRFQQEDLAESPRTAVKLPGFPKATVNLSLSRGPMWNA